MDNLVHSPAGWVLIDWELAGPAGQHVFRDSTYLPPEVNSGQMPYTATCDLWQLGRIMQRYDVLSTGATKQFANQLISMQFASAEHALSAMPEVECQDGAGVMVCVCTDITALVAIRFRNFRIASICFRYLTSPHSCSYVIARTVFACVNSTGNEVTFGPQR